MRTDAVVHPNRIDVTITFNSFPEAGAFRSASVLLIDLDGGADGFPYIQNGVMEAAAFDDLGDGNWTPDVSFWNVSSWGQLTAAIVFNIEADDSSVSFSIDTQMARSELEGQGVTLPANPFLRSLAREYSTTTKDYSADIAISSF
jgi:hypothetical protein